jgi:DNA repair protein SbcC/Rad50
LDLVQLSVHGLDVDHVLDAHGHGLGTNRYSELEYRIAKCGVLTKGRFKKIEMNGDSPDVFGLEHDLSIPFELLSHGTKDTVPLAWRFAVTEQFLGKGRGFLVLDDPMVDMDPNRRKLASDTIREFSDKHQVIVMTCHPEHQRELKKA